MLFSGLEYHYILRLIVQKGETRVMSTDRYHLLELLVKVTTEFQVSKVSAKIKPHT